jgi:hypothetical protein
MTTNWKLKEIISGGQTGVERAGLDAALEAGLEIGGYCPKGRKAEYGKIPERYPLIETPSGDYRVRTEKNVLESDATLILNVGRLSGGTALTEKHTRKHKKPCLVIQLEFQNAGRVDRIRRWLAYNDIQTLNVAGCRESKSMGIYMMALKLLRKVLIGAQA